MLAEALWKTSAIILKNDKSDSKENEVLKTKSTYWTNEELETESKDKCQPGAIECQPNDIADENDRLSSWNNIYWCVLRREQGYCKGKSGC